MPPTLDPLRVQLARTVITDDAPGIPDGTTPYLTHEITTAWRAANKALVAVASDAALVNVDLVADGEVYQTSATSLVRHAIDAERALTRYTALMNAAVNAEAARNFGGVS